jgi:predicted GNAT family N-acyltransferase
MILDRLSKSSTHRLKIIEYDSAEYHQAAQLRYQLFYREYDIPFASIFTPQELEDLHLAIVDSSTNSVLAYGRLGRASMTEFKIYQMVVVPEYQRRGLGTRVLLALFEAASDRGASLVILNARLTKIPFYRKFGFQSVGEVFPSIVTGEPHIQMQRICKLRDPYQSYFTLEAIHSDTLSAV